MTNTTTRQINKEACAWIARLHGAEPSQQELQEFREWMAQSPAHKAEVRHLSKLWGELNALTELAVTVVPPEKTHWTKILQARLFSRTALRGAAACAMLVLLVVLTLSFQPGIEPHTSPVITHQTRVGEQRLITLDDGSSVLLDTGTQLRVNYIAGTRNIYLDHGQAHFDVISNPDRPFRVFAGGGMVRAVGTAFAVYLKEAKLEVIVTEGSIELSAIDQPLVDSTPLFNETALAKVERLVVVKAGQNVTFDQAVKSIESIETVGAPSISRKLSWREGLLKFSGDPLQDVVAEISRYTNISIVILDPEIRQLRIGGFFRVGEIEKMFEALEAGFGVRVERIGDDLVHLAAATPPDDTDTPQ